MLLPERAAAVTKPSRMRAESDGLSRDRSSSPCTPAPRARLSHQRWPEALALRPE